jgi:hypothetical protein
MKKEKNFSFEKMTCFVGTAKTSEREAVQATALS